jgi:nucleoside-diphosphate-sugar epimerase
MKILVVGSGGFLGSHVTEKLKIMKIMMFLEIVGKGQVDITNFDDLKLYLDSK